MSNGLFTAPYIATPNGQEYSGLHDGEAVFSDISTAGGLLANGNYELIVSAYQIFLSGGSLAQFKTPDLFFIYGVRNGQVLPPSRNTLASTSLIDGLPRTPTLLLSRF